MDLIAGCLAVLEETRLAAVDDAAAARFAEEAPDSLLSLPRWDDPGFYTGPKGPAWLLAYNAINYCYWRDDDRRWWTVVDGRDAGQDDEALGIMAAFGHALARGVPLDDGSWLQELDPAGLADLLRPAPGAAPLPHLDRRLAALHELGRAYLAHGGPDGILALARGSAPELVRVLVRVCPSWEDVRGWSDRVLPFRKRAQLCVSMIVGWSRGQGPGDLSGLDAITAFADYRLPQVLRGAHVLRLDPDLAARIERHEPVPAGSPEEIAIRAATVVAAERIRVHLQGRAPGANALVVDHLLWRTAVARQDSLPPFHRTVTTDY